MKRKKIANSLYFALTLVFLGGCAAESAIPGVLEEDTTYVGKSGTSEVIVVDSKDSWTIKDRHEDDTTYSVVNVTDTGEKVGDYAVVELVATEIVGDDTPFAKREGREYIVAEDEEGLYFRSVAEENRAELETELSSSEDTVDYIKEVANYRFTKQ